MTKQEYLNAKFVVENPKGYDSRDVQQAIGEVDKWEFAHQRAIEELEKVEDYANKRVIEELEESIKDVIDYKEGDNVVVDRILSRLISLKLKQ